MKNIIVIEGAEIEDKLNKAFEAGYRIISQSSVAVECKRSQGYTENSTAFIKTVILQLPEVTTVVKEDKEKETCPHGAKKCAGPMKSTDIFSSTIYCTNCGRDWNNKYS